MTAWLVLTALTALFTLAVRRLPHPAPAPLAGYDRERQDAELRALR